VTAANPRAGEKVPALLALSAVRRGRSAFLRSRSYSFMLMALWARLVIPKLKITPSSRAFVPLRFSAGLSGCSRRALPSVRRKKLLLFFYSGFVARYFAVRVGFEL